MADASTRTLVFHGRTCELERLSGFLRAPGSGFTFLRGRRRIGKSELLKKVRQGEARTFYFMGRDDE